VKIKEKLILVLILIKLLDVSVGKRTRNSEPKVFSRPREDDLVSGMIGISDVAMC